MTILEIQEKYSVSSLVAQVLWAAELSEKQIEEVLFPQLLLHDCFSEAMDKTVARIMLAKQRKERVFIGGDYDADGLCATTILKETLDALGIENGFYIPNRFSQGYGLHPETVEMAADKGYSLILTVDNGVAAKEAIEMAHQKHVEIYITDHHTIQDVLTWDHLLHPSLMGEGFEMMCGAGIALEISRRCIGENRKHTVLAMIATLADMMPLFGENRIIVRKGLEFLNEDRNLFVEALNERPVKKWTEKEIAFQIVPKLNAVGRLADRVNPNNVVRYLLLNKKVEIEKLAEQLKSVNNSRKEMSDKMAIQAEKMLQEEDFLFVADESFHEGLVGLVANKLMMSTHKPVAVFNKSDGIYKGSVRTFGDLNLMEFLEEFKPLCLSFGGHAAAAGISLNQENYLPFYQAVQKKMKTVQIGEKKENTIPILSKDCTLKGIEELNRLAPFGQGFPQPKFEISEFRILNTQILKEKYPKWRCENENFEFEVISFSLNKDCVQENLHSFIGELSINEFRGRKTVSVLADKCQ